MAYTDEGDELVWVKHPEVEGLGGPLGASTLDHWAELGWSRATDAEVAEHEAFLAAVEAGVVELPNASDPKAEWEKAAKVVGIDPEGKTKDELIDEVSKTT